MTFSIELDDSNITIPSEIKNNKSGYIKSTNQSVPQNHYGNDTEKERTFQIQAQEVTLLNSKL